MTARARLPNRWPHEVISFNHFGFAYSAGIGRSEYGRATGPLSALLDLLADDGGAW